MHESMTSIATLKNSITDIINAGQTKRHLEQKDFDTKLYLINEDKINAFWKNIKRYADKDDTLYILNIPLSKEEILNEIELEPYEKTIFYLPSKKISITENSRNILFKKGIVLMQQRDNNRCFYGDYKNETVKKWMKLNKLISFESIIHRVYTKDKLILDGILSSNNNDSTQTINKISNNDFDYFESIGELIKADVKRLNCKGQGFAIFSSEHSGIDLLRLTLQEFLSNKIVPIGVEGNNESLLLTRTPKFARYMFSRCNFKQYEHFRLGNGAAILFNEKNHDAFLITIGKITPSEIIIHFNEPVNVHERTLRRRLMGEEGFNGKKYIGLKDRYNSLNLYGNYISTPRDAIDEVTDILTESGSTFKIIV